MTVQDQVDAGKINAQSVPAGCLNNQPVMLRLEYLKLLHDLNPNKAAGSDGPKPLVLKELREVSALILMIVFQRSVETGRVSKDWSDANVCPSFKNRCLKLQADLS